MNTCRWLAEDGFSCLNHKIKKPDQKSIALPVWIWYFKRYDISYDEIRKGWHILCLRISINWIRHEIRINMGWNPTRYAAICD